MKSRGLFFALIVLIVLVGLLYWSNHKSVAKSPESADSATALPKILALNQADILKVEIKKGGNDVVLSKNAAGGWHITSPKEYGTDSAAVSGLLSTLSALNAERVVEDKAGDLQPYGLKPASAELIVTENGSKSYDLLLGDATPTHSGSYVALVGDPRVFTIATSSKAGLDKSLNDLRDKRFLTVDNDKINRLELITKTAELEFDRYKDHWQIVKPRPLRADGNLIDDAIRTLTNARVDLNQAGADKIEPSFAKAETVGTARVMSDAGTQELNVRKIGDNYYAKSSVTDAPYKISNEAAQTFSKGLDDFRNKKLFDFGYVDPNKVEFRDGQKSYFLTKGGADWWGPDGKKMEALGADTLIEKLRDLKATKFVDSGFESPTIEITVTSSDGQAEKVQISKNGTSCMAKRENDSSLYQLDGKAVEELQHAAAEMKVASNKEGKPKKS